MTQTDQKKPRGISWQASFAIGVAVAVLLMIVGVAKGATSRDMATATRALRYPQASLKVTCTGSTVYRCKATLTHHRTRRFYAEWQGQGGWIQAGAKASTMKPLRHGFIPAGEASSVGGSGNAAELAVIGYVTNQYGATAQKTSACTVTATSASCGYQIPTGQVTVTVTLKAVTGGWITTAAVS